MSLAKHIFQNAESHTPMRVVNRRPVEVLPKADLTTQRMVFRLLNPGDLDAFKESLSASRSLVRRWIPVNHEHESDEHFFKRTMVKARVQDIEGVAWRRGAFLDDGSFVGMFNLIKIQRGLEWTCETNWWVDARMCGQGLASEAVQGMVDYALADHPVGLGMHRVRAMICADNPASVRVANKCGFRANGGRELLNINNALVAHDEYECIPV
jgi:[ribosomal protein S5]-alanine N-acetyltransferase